MGPKGLGERKAARSAREFGGGVQRRTTAMIADTRSNNRKSGRSTGCTGQIKGVLTAVHRGLKG